MDAVRAHKFTAARRKGEWEIIESPKRAERPTNAATAGATAAIAALTAREREVLALIVAGVKNREIAARLGISQRTIEVYRTRILLKTRAKNLPDLVRMAIIGGIDERRR
jgi:FixJ family two-component response regulator